MHRSFLSPLVAISCWLCCGTPGVAADFPAVFNTEKTPGGPMPAEEVARTMDLPPGFSCKVFAAEPDVQQPIAMAWDARGRLWVAECYTYAENPARWNTSLRDRILIFEDGDNDGRFDKRTVFWDEGVRLTSIEIGNGGVYALCAPNLIFLPDGNGDDVPDGPPEVLLDGFNFKTIGHNIVNGLRWGPDGWLYGRHGITDTSAIGAPGTPQKDRTRMNCGIFRYDPVRRKFEVVLNGGTNSWGMDWDANGELFWINTVIGHLFHGIPGAYNDRMFGTHLNPHVYETIGQTADHYHFDQGREKWADVKKGMSSKTSELGGGHAHIGCVIYNGGTWPREYAGKLFTCNLHGNRINMDILVREGCGFVARHGADFMQSKDTWFRGIDLSTGPDGSVFVIDWSDAGECHDSDGVHRTSGRIYKITSGATQPARTFDLSKMDDAALTKEAAAHPGNNWWPRMIARVRADRGTRLTEPATPRLANAFSSDGLVRLHVASAMQRLPLEATIISFTTNGSGWHIRFMSNTSSQLSRNAHAAKDGYVSKRKPKAYSYLRFSTADQIRGDSFRRQTELARTWCEKTGVPLVDNYRDLGVSAFRGANADKGALKAFLDRVESGVIEPGSYLIVESLDRLSRTDITFALQMFLGLINAGIVVVTLADQRVYDRERINDGNFTDIIISLTILSRANEESRIKSSRLCAAWANKRARASVEKTTSRCPSWLRMKPDKSGFELIPEKAAIVRRIFEMTALGKGQNHIAKVFTLEKVPCLSKSARRWYCNTVKNVLLSRAVIGEYVPSKMIGGKRSFLEGVPDYFPAAIPMDLYAAVQRMHRVRPSYRGRGQTNPLAGMLFNVMTGNRMARVSKGPKKKFTYLLDSAAPTGGAPYKTWQFEQFLKSLLTVCEAITTAPTVPHKENPELLAALKRLDEVEVQIPRLVEFIASGFSTSVDQKMRELEKEKAALEKKIAEFRVEENAADLDVSEINWTDTQRLKENIRAVIRRIDVHPFDRWFKVTLFDGREVIYREAGNEIEIVSSESTALLAPEGTGTNRRSRRRQS